MLVDARREFAERAVFWMMEDTTLTAEDMTARVGLWPKDFQKLITECIIKYQSERDYEEDDEEPA